MYNIVMLNLKDQSPIRELVTLVLATHNLTRPWRLVLPTNVALFYKLYLKIILITPNSY